MDSSRGWGPDHADTPVHWNRTGPESPRTVTLGVPRMPPWTLGRCPVTRTAGPHPPESTLATLGPKTLKAP